MSEKEDAFAGTFKTVMIVLVVIGLIIFAIAKFVTGGFYSSGATNDAAVAERTKPVAEPNVGTVAAAAAPQADAKPAVVDGKAVFQGACFACHGTGAAGAPKLGDAANWGPRIAQGIDKVNSNALNGFQGKDGVMPPKGGRTDLSDAEVLAAVQYMVDNSK